MKLSTAIIQTIEMTRDEEATLFDAQVRIVCGKKVHNWDTSDGRNEILLEGETIWRTVILKK